MELIENVIKREEIGDSTKKCEYCGKPYKEKRSTYNIPKLGLKVFSFVEPDCNCLEKLKKEKELKQKQELEIITQKEKTAKLFDNSMITPFFKEKTFANLKETKEIIRCKDFVSNFKPKESKGIQMIGEPGTGKTTALVAICNELIAQGYNCLFTPLSTLLDKFSYYSYSNFGDIRGLLDWLVLFDFVVLDDIGRETYTDKRKENVFRIIDNLMNYKVVVAFTANPNMIAKLKSIPELEAGLDRLKEMCPIKFEFKGESYRGK